MIVFALFSALVQAAPNDIYPYTIHAQTLANGLDVIVVPMKSDKVASVHTWMAVGSRDELDSGRTGFAHFFEHLMFYDTKTMSRHEREAILQRMGAEENAWTWFDDTVYHATLSTDHVEQYLIMEGDRFQSLMLTEEMVRKEAGAVYGEFRKSEASPDNRIIQELYATAFTTHTYGHDTIGYEADIAEMPSAFAYAGEFFDRYYRPGNAAVIVTGDVDPKEVMSWVDKAYGSWKAADTPRPTVPAEPAQEALRTHSIDWPTPTATRYVTGFKAPAYDPDNSDVASLQLLASLLKDPGGDLTRRLVREESLAYQVYVSLDDPVDPGLFTVSVILKDAEGVSKVEAIVNEELAALKNQVDPNRLEATQSHDRYAYLTGLDSPNQVASDLGWTWRRTGSTDAANRFYRQYDALTPEQLTEVANRYFVDAQRTTVTLQYVPTDTPEKAP